MTEQQVVLIEAVKVQNWEVSLFSNGTAVLRARYWNRRNYIYNAEWDKEQGCVLYSPYDSEYQPKYLFKAVNAIFKRNLDKIGVNVNEQKAVESEVVAVEAVEVAVERVWTPYDASAAVEGFDGQEHDEETLLSAWQYLVDSGLAWRLQGWYGRTASVLISQGLINAPAKG
jgi:hypothetical protein